MKHTFFLLAIALLLFAPVYCREQEKVSFIPKGHLALSTSQETSPLFCFGQNIVDKGDIQIFAYGDSFLGKNNNFTELIPLFFYGITDDLSFITGSPVAINIRLSNNFALRGVESIVAQLEYAFFNDDHATYANQATIVSNVVVPARSYRINLPSAFDGAPTFFLGFTASHMDFDWYYFGSCGLIAPILYRGMDGNTQFLYQGGVSRNIYYISNNVLIALLLEFFGTFSYQNSSNFDTTGAIKNHSFYIGPSLWTATQHFIFQVGVAFSVTGQHYLGFLNRCLLAFEIGWKFND